MKTRFSRFLFLAVLLALAAHPVAGQGHVVPPNVRPLTLAEVLRLVHADNPDIATALTRLEAARARISGADAWMAPMVGVNAMNIPVESLNPLDAGMGVRFMFSQTLPWPGKLKPGVAVAEASADEAGATIEAQRRLLEGQVIPAYGRLALITHNRHIYEQQLVLLNRISELTLQRYRTGAGTQQDVLRAGLEITQLYTRMLGLQTDYGQAAGVLRVLLGEDRPDSLVAATALEEVVRLLEADALGVQLADETSGRPEFAQLAARRRAVEARLRSLRVARRPDVTVNAEYAWVGNDPVAEAPMEGEAAEPAAMGGGNTWTVGLTFTLPTAPWSRRGLTADEDYWRTESRALEQEEASLRRRIRSEQLTYRAQTDVARASLRLFDAETMPQARMALESALGAYEAGNGDLTALLEAWRAMLDLDHTRTEVLSGYIQALAAYRQSLGLPVLPELVP